MKRIEENILAKLNSILGRSCEDKYGKGRHDMDTSDES
jgi:hypothetical protein